MTASRQPTRSRARIAGAAVAVVVAALLAACGGGDRSPAPVVAGATVESIETADGLRLDARLFDAGPERLVVLLHMFPADQQSWASFASELQASGQASALTLDFRGYGASEGPKDVGKIDRDVRAALAFARGRGYEQVALVGASMGGTAAIVVAAAEPVAGLITLSAPSEFRGLDAAAVVAEVDAPLVVFASRGDTAAAHALGEFVELAGLPEPDRARLWEGRDHGTDLLDGVHGAEVRAELLRQLARFWSD
ncbi:MAG: alpha/beta fold hydrolase [Dehalococcoidia bacterium]